MEDIEKRASLERRRIIRTLKKSEVPEMSRKTLEPIIENVAWMKVKLDDARELIKQSNVAIPYDNGGGQKGIRENPLFKGYEALWKSYISGMQSIIRYLPQAEAEKADTEPAPRTVLEIIKSRHEA